MDTTLAAPSDPRVKALILGLRGLVNAAQAHGSADEIAIWRATFFTAFEQALRARHFDDRPAPPRPPERAPQWIVPLTVFGAIGSLVAGGLITARCFTDSSGCDGGLCALCLAPLILGVAGAAIIGVGGALIRFAMSRTLQRSIDAAHRPQFPVSAEGRVRAVHRLLAGASAEVVASECGVVPDAVRAWWAVALDEGARALKA